MSTLTLERSRIIRAAAVACRLLHAVAAAADRRHAGSSNLRDARPPQRSSQLQESWVTAA
jgi:hypothetical protein